MRILNAEAHRLREERLIAASSSLALMESAGAAVVEVICAEKLHSGGGVVVCCGPGNNGGDGWVAARRLYERIEKSAVLSVYSFGKQGSLSEEALECRRRAEASGLAVREVVTDSDVKLLSEGLCKPDILVVDALFGSGLNRPITGVLAHVVDELNRCANLTRAKVVSIDIPSGLAGDSHSIIGPTVKADCTVALVCARVAHVVRPAAKNIGRLTIESLGPEIELDEEDGQLLKKLPMLHLTEAEDVKGFQSWRSRAPSLDSHKGDFGRVTIAAGSKGKAGAAQLAGLAALRAGAGLVTIVGPESCAEEISRVPECMTLGLPDRDGIVSGVGLDVVDSVRHDVIAVGPGLGVGAGPKALLEKMLGFVDTPLVLDADALTVLSRDGGFSMLDGTSRVSPVIVTPHPGEMSRLTGKTVEQVQANRLSIASEFAISRSVYVVLKGGQTVIASPDGDIFINSTGNPGMATGGSGDVLTGLLVGSLGREVAQGDGVEIQWKRVLRDVVYLHGYAGDLAAKKFGQRGLIASDIADNFGQAVCKHGGL